MWLFIRSSPKRIKQQEGPMSFMSLQIIPELGFATTVNLPFYECNNCKNFCSSNS